LLILDMYRETIEHPFSIPEPIKNHLDLTSGKDLGRLYNLVPEAGYRHRRPRLDMASDDDLVATLADPSAWWRETAQRLLIERKAADAVPALKALVRDRPTPLARVHALWILQVLDSLGDDELTLALKDTDPGVREQAARLAEGHLGDGSQVTAPLLALARDADPMVRLQVAFTLGFVTSDANLALDALATIARHDIGDQWIRAAVLSSLPGRPADLMERLAGPSFEFFSRPEGKPWLSELAQLVGMGKNPAAIEAVLNRFTSTDSNPTLIRDVLLGLGTGLKRSGSTLRDSLRGPGAAGLQAVFTRAAMVAEAEGPIEVRVDSIGLLGLGPIEVALEKIPSRLDAREPNQVQLAAIQAMKDIPDHRVATLIIGRWKALSPSVRREAIEALFARPDHLKSLVDALKANTINPSELDSARRQQLLAHSNPSIRNEAEEVFRGFARQDRNAVISAFRAALSSTGDRQKGMEVFNKACATCHRAEGRGFEIGPNLTTVSGRTPEDLLIHILDPNREIAPNYLNYSVETIDGLTITGLIAEESASAVTLKRAGGAIDIIPRNRIESIASTGRSLMPEGLETGFEPKDIAELISYLRSLQAGGQANPSR
jgi:putative heme-binding domain-containing protein